MKKFLSCFYCIVFFTVVVSRVWAQSNRIEDIVPKITGEDYEKTKLRISQITEQLHEGDNFHTLKEYSSSGFSHVKNDPSFQFNFMLNYECKITKQYHLSQARLLKRGYINMNNKKHKTCVSVDIFFGDSKICRAYSEFFPPDDYCLMYSDEGYLTEIDYRGTDGLRTARFDKTQMTEDKLNNKYRDNTKQEHTLIREGFAQLSSKQVTKSEVKLVPDYCTKIPDKLMSSNIRSFLSRAEKYRVACMEGKVEPLLSNPIFIPPKPTQAELANPNFGGVHDKWRSYIRAFYFGEAIAFVGVKGWNRRDCGFFLVFDEQLRLQRYVEGEVEFDYNSSGHEVAKAAKLSDDGSGIEVTFHNNGYPSTYKSIVKKRLFGRQIEWNDKGEVVSDVDLDIPKEMEKYPPSKIESKPK